MCVCLCVCIYIYILYAYIYICGCACVHTGTVVHSHFHFHSSSSSSPSSFPFPPIYMHIASHGLCNKHPPILYIYSSDARPYLTVSAYTYVRVCVCVCVGRRQGQTARSNFFRFGLDFFGEKRDGPLYLLQTDRWFMRLSLCMRWK